MGWKISFFFTVSAIVVLSVFIFIRRRPAYKQGIGTVTVREPGHRLLGPPQPDTTAAAEDVIPALVSQAAYMRKPPDRKATKPGKHDKNIPWIDPDQTLKDHGWEPWPEFLNPDDKCKLARVHLRAEVWSNAQEKVTIVAFGGTEFRNINDWKANFRWLIPLRHDEYSVLINTYVEQFADEYQSLSTTTKYAFLSDAALYSTGHSLGAGLAEAFAYALPLKPGVPRVIKVYAFDPTPVTSFTSIDKSTRNANAQNLKIDRIYERREVLAILRSITSFFHLPPACQPQVRQIRYNLFPTINVINGHSIPELAALLWKACEEKPAFPDRNVTETCYPSGRR